MRKLYWAPLLLLFVVSVAGAEPPSYYNSAQGKAGHVLFDALHVIVSGHTVIPYSSSTKLDTSDALKVLDEDPADTNNVMTFYAGESEPKSTFGQTTSWNREHRWCNAYGLDSKEPSYSDLFNLHAEDYNVNSSRGDKYYDVSNPAGPNYHNPAHAEAPLCSTDFDSWEPPSQYKGAIARSIFYMATRYTGDHTNEPALHITDDIALIQSTNSYMGKLSTLIAWNAQYPVTTAESNRAELVYSLYQHNRNPFVDHPEWVNLIFAPLETNPPVLNIAALSNGVALSWIATNQSAQLLYTTNLSAPWSTAPATPVLSNAQFVVTWTNGDAAFFRLRVQ